VGAKRARRPWNKTNTRIEHWKCDRTDRFCRSFRAPFLFLNHQGLRFARTWLSSGCASGAQRQRGNRQSAGRRTTKRAGATEGSQGVSGSESEHDAPGIKRIHVSSTGSAIEQIGSVALSELPSYSYTNQGLRFARPWLPSSRASGALVLCRRFSPSQAADDKCRQGILLDIHKSV
jgi:hypothetical protein